MTAIAYVPAGMSSKSQRACVLRIFITITLVAELKNSVGKPSDDSKSAHATVPVLFLMFRIFMWIPGHGDCAKVMPVRFTNINTATHATHRASMGTRILRSLAVEAPLTSEWLTLGNLPRPAL